jgi:hypothetical protein
MAKPKVTKNHRTSPQDAASRLTVEQLNGIELLIQGQHDHAVASALGLARETVSRWRLNPYFVATLNHERQALWEQAHQRLRGLVNRAIDILAAALKENDVRTAVELLKIVRIYGEVPPPSGPTDPEEVVWQEVQTGHLAEKRREVPTVDPMQLLLDEHAGQDAVRLHDRHQAARQQWGLDDGDDQ